MSVLVLAVVAAGLVAVGPYAEAAPVFVRASLDAGGYAGTYSADCVTEDRSSPDVEDLAVVENGPAVSAQRSSTATTTYTPEPSDVVSTSSAVTGTAEISSVGADLGSIEFVAEASAALSPSSAAAACHVSTSSYLVMDYEFLVTRPGFLTITMSNRGDIYTSLSVSSGSGDKREDVWLDRYFSANGQGLKVDSTTTVYLPPGVYYGFLDGSVEVTGNVARSLSGTGSVKATFAVAGSQTMAASGKGKRYVTFPAARSCDSHTLASSITGKGKRVKRIKQVAFVVNDTVVKRVRTPDRGETVLLPVVDEQGGQVRAVVKLFPTRKGKPGRVVEVSGAYAPCS